MREGEKTIHYRKVSRSQPLLFDNVPKSSIIVFFKRGFKETF